MTAGAVAAIDAGVAPAATLAIGPPAGAAAVHSLGLMRIGTTVLALPVSALREVIPCPARLAPLPLATGGLLGAVSLRGTVIPVLDLRSALGTTSGDAATAPVIVVMRWAGRLLGLRADRVCGIARVETRHLHALTTSDAAGGSHLASHSFESDDGVATLLDPQRIAALPGVPMVPERTAGSGEPGGAPREPVLLFSSAGMSFAIAAMDVDATVPRTILRANALNSALCRGVIDHHGHEVPVVDTLALLGLGQAPAGNESAVLVLRFPTGRVGLMLDDVRDIAPIAAADILPLPALAVQRRALFRGVLADDETSLHFLLDARALQADPVLRALAAIGNTASVAAADGAVAASIARSARSYLTYDVGVETASPLIQVSEILPYPTNATALTNGHAAVLGIFTHRGIAVPLVSLCGLLGRTAQPLDAAARVLLVQDAGEIVGLVVQALRSIETASWEQAPSAASAASSTLAGVRRFQPLVEVGPPELRRTLPRLDLLLLVRALRAESGHADSSPPVPVG